MKESNSEVVQDAGKQKQAGNTGSVENESARRKSYSEVVDAVQYNAANTYSNYSTIYL